MAKQKQIILRNAHRDALKLLRDKIVQCVYEDTAVRKAYLKAAPLVRKIVQTEYPPKDMKVLQKYEKADIDDCIKLRMTHGAVQDMVFNFDEGTGPLAVENTYNGKFYLADEETTDAVLQWKSVVDARDAKLREKKGDYLTLINAARTLEEVETLWPEASEIRQAFEKNQVALMALTPTVIQRIRQDVAERAASA